MLAKTVQYIRFSPSLVLLAITVRYWRVFIPSIGPVRAPRHNTNSTLLKCWQKQSSIDDFYPSSQYKTKQTPNVGNKSPLEKSFHSHWARKGPQTQNYWTVPNWPLYTLGAKLGPVPNWLRCQIDSFHTLGAKLGPVPNWLFYTLGAKLTPQHSWCQIGSGAKLGPVPNCPPTRRNNWEISGK